MVTRENLNPIERALRDRIRREETLFGRTDRETDSLWDHLERVSRLAERLGKTEGVDPVAARLAGLFHDAGKFSEGRYHEDERPEEERSVECLRELAGEHGLAPSVLEEVAEAILQLYRDDPNLSPLARVLFDADNLDKLGPLGIANRFVKVGLRGHGVSPKALHRLTVEMTYARHAPRCMATESGRLMAEKRAPATVNFIIELLRTLREDGLYDFKMEEVVHNGLTLDVVVPESCNCGGKLERNIWEVSGIKCTEIHIQHTCADCGESQELRFCKPRLRCDVP
jgi:uncharacterized protein